MKFKIILLSLFLGSPFINISTAQKSITRPKLVIGIVVDQMRWDYLYRYYDRYGEGGFKRLLKEGFSAEQTFINYLPSYTAPGHASIYTGSVPALHGITGNDWFEYRSGKDQYCTQDDGALPIGSNNKAGKMSPKNLKANTITDELRLATNFKGKTFGISIKDRGAILPGGHAANGAFWLSGQEGKFITSDYYMKSLPKWVSDFNNRNIVDSLLNITWNPLYPIATYLQSTSDSNRYEGTTKGLSSVSFPHVLKDQISDNKGIIRSTPHGNTLINLLAMACIENESLGADEITDMLALSYSSTDYIGHLYGPNAIEVEDTYLRLDKEIALLLKFLDNKMKGQYTIFLTADHGGAHNTMFLNDHKMPGTSILDNDLKKTINDILETNFGSKQIVSKIMNYQVYLNDALIQEKNLDKAAIRNSIKNTLYNNPAISNVIDIDESDHQLLPATLREMVANGYHNGRSGSIQYILNPGSYAGDYSTGTTHGSWNLYDTHIPGLFFGWGIKQGTTQRRTEITDFAATIAALLHIQMPNACIGKPIYEALK